MITIIIVAIIVFLGLFSSIIYLAKRFLISNSEHYSNASISIYNIVAAIGLIATGIWAFSTFNLLNQRDIAQSQYEELQLKIKSVESSKISLSTEVVDYAGTKTEIKSKGVIIKVKLTNVGNTAVEFDLSKSPLKIYEVEAQDIKIGYKKVYKPSIYSKLAPLNGKSKNVPLSKFVSLTSSERELSYFAVLPINKMYYITFITEAGDLSSSEINKSDSTKNKIPQCNNKVQCKWFSAKYIYLQ